jgi:hypothetical protein
MLSDVNSSKILGFNSFSPYRIIKAGPGSGVPALPMLTNLKEVVKEEDRTVFTCAYTWKSLRKMSSFFVLLFTSHLTSARTNTFSGSI